LLCAATGLAGLSTTGTLVAPLLGRSKYPPGNEPSAIGALKTINVAQVLFRKNDTEGDGVHDYGTLSELAMLGSPQDGLVDPVLGSGTKQGYLFESSHSRGGSEWFATASPTIPTVTGNRYFATNHLGVIYYSTTAPIPMNTRDATLPASRLRTGDIRPLGR
jgi:hypothetical protein